MIHHRAIIISFEMFIYKLGKNDRAMLAAGTAYCYNKLTLALLAVKGHGVINERKKSFRKLLGLRQCHYKVLYRSFKPCMASEVFNIKRVFKAPDVKNNVSL